MLAAMGAAIVALAVGAAVASGAVSFTSPTPVPPTAVAVVATPTVDLAVGAAELREAEHDMCDCNK
jgi:hypothetical protein